MLGTLPTLPTRPGACNRRTLAMAVAEAELRSTTLEQQLKEYEVDRLQRCMRAGLSAIGVGQ